MRASRATLLALGCAAVVVLAASHGHAQARNPFNVGITEGGGAGNGLVRWIIARQMEFERGLSAAIRAVRGDPAAIRWLAGLSFIYGVFHAAGPGHGKAVVASYMLANERALRRGLAISLMAALFQGLVAILIVGGLDLALHATAARMTAAASFVEMASFAGIAVLGAWLTWRKGLAFLRVVRAPAPALAMAGGGSSRFACEACDVDSAADHAHDENCGHFHMPNPASLGASFSWRSAALTILAAGSRPCSGAIIVLVFALAQGLFFAGIVSTIAMSLGVAITTGALAAVAVLAKDVALRITGAGTSRGLVVARGLEFAAAIVVMALGVALCLGYATAGI